jgi:hypothetical protein
VFAVLPFQVAIGLDVAEDSFGLRVELQLTASARDDVCQVRVGCRDVSQFDFRIRRLTAADAINEIAAGLLPGSPTCGGGQSHLDVVCCDSTSLWQITEAARDWPLAILRCY